MLTIKQAPFTGPYSNADTELDSSGPTVEALKRAVSRLGYITWKGKDFDDAWPKGAVFDRGFRRWQKARELPADGVYGEQTWKQMRSAKVPAGKPHAGEYALDALALKLLREDYALKNPPDETDVRAALVKFCLAAERNEGNWHYAMVRPLDVSVEPTARYIVSDCSFYVKQAYWWAAQKAGVAVPDPAKYGWAPYGNTSEYEDDHPRVTNGKFLVGDLAHYQGHVTLCRRAGTATTAVFSSHGQEAGPMPTSLYYRSDLRFVVRPPLK